MLKRSKEILNSLNCAELSQQHSIFSKSHPFWSEGFRPFFLLLPFYAMISIIPWGLIWGGVIHTTFDNQLLYWHIYEMLYGLGTAGIIGFLLTAIPEFIKGTPRIRGYQLAGLLGLWLLGRVSFWFFDLFGLWVNFVIHLGLSLILIGVLTKPIWLQSPKRNIGFWWGLVLLTLLQALFFISQSNKVISLPFYFLNRIETHQWLYAALNAYMILIILVLRRVSMGVTNTLLNQYNTDEKYIARPPMYNLAVSSLLVFLMAEIFMPNQSVLGWLAWAVASALLNLFNDLFKLPLRILFWHHIRYVCLIILLMAVGYIAIGWDYLSPSFNKLNHLRHILTTGLIGLSYLVILSIVSVRHTGRKLHQTYVLDLMVLLILVSLILRLAIILKPEFSATFYMWSSVVWALAFGLFFIKYAKYIVRKNVN